MNKKLEIRFPLIFLFSSPFFVWQMGVFYFSGKTLSLFGRTPVQLISDDTIVAILLGYVASILFICFFPRRTVYAQRCLLPIALIASFGMFFAKSGMLFSVLFYIAIFICVFSIGTMLSIASHLFTEETAWWDGIISAFFGGIMIAILQNDFIYIDFTIFNLLSCVFIIMLLVFHFRIPPSITCEYVSKKNPRKMPKILFLGLWMLIVFSTLLLCFANSFAESTPGGVSVLYLSTAFVGFLLWILRRRFFDKSIKYYSVFFALTVFAFVAAVLSLQFPFLKLFVCAGLGFVVVLSNLWTYFACLSFQIYPTRFIGVIGAVTGMVLATLHSVLQEMMRGNLTVLFAVYAVISMAMMLAYYFVEPFFFFAWTKYKGKKKADSVELDLKQKQCFRGLSEQEQNLAKLILQGYVESSIAQIMNISINTQKSYRKNLYTKLDIHSKRELFELVEKQRT